MPRQFPPEFRARALRLVEATALKNLDRSFDASG